MKHLWLFAAAILIILSVQNLNAQDRFSFELRTGAAFATQTLGDADLETGWGIEGYLGYRFMNRLGAYAGWGYNRFGAEASFMGNDMEFEETGYALGLEYTLPIADGPLAVYARGGAIYNHIEVENNNGDIISDSGHGWGWQSGAGLVVTMGDTWELRPGVKYQYLTRDISFESSVTPVDLTYFGLQIGIAKRF